MILEALISGLVGNILKELVVQAITQKWKRLDEKKVEKIVAAYLAQHPSPVHTTTITKEVMIIVGTAGLVGPHGQINLPGGTSDAQSIIDGLETEYLKGVKRRLGPP